MKHNRVLLSLMFCVAIAAPAVAQKNCEGCFTIGVPALIGEAYYCTDKEAAMVVATMSFEKGTMATFSSNEVQMLEQSGACGYAQLSFTTMPLSVIAHGEIEQGKILKVVTSAVVYDPDVAPEPADNIYLILDTEVIGSGIEELAGIPV